MHPAGELLKGHVCGKCLKLDSKTLSQSVHGQVSRNILILTEPHDTLSHKNVNLGWEVF